MSFGKRFKELRLEKNLKQQELADDFNKIYGHNFAKSSISQYENDKRKPETESLANFASYFNVSIDYLLGISDDKHNNINYNNMGLRDKCSSSALEFFKNETISREEKDKLFKDITKLYFDSLK
jgi:transcriptional regulator with XRE-family HTH domain